MEDFSNNAVSADEVAEFTATAKAHGVPEDQIADTLRKAGYAPDASTSSGTSPPKRDPGEQPFAAGSRFSKNEVDQYTKDALASGRTVEEVQAVLKQNSVDWAPAPSTDTRSGQAIEHDRAWTPPTSDSIRPIKPTLPIGTTEAEYAAAVTDARAFVHQVGFENDIGASVVEEAFDVMAKLDRMSLEEKQTWANSQTALLISMVGEANVQKTLDDAARALGNAKTGKFYARCVASGCNYSADLLLQLAGRGSRMAIRKTF